MMRAMPESMRIRGVQAPVIPILGRWVRETPGTISLGQGVVSYGPPPAALEAARRFGADPDDHIYGPVEGDPELLDALAGKLAADNGISLGTSSRLVVTAGANMAFVDAVLAIADPGDDVILQVPYYFNHEMAVGMAGCRAVAVATDSRYQLALERIAAAITPRTRAIVTISPNNPSGAVYPEATLREVNRLCAARGLYHIHDEAYEYFVYDGARHFSPGSIEGAGPHTISIFSMSKTYGLASWRIGYTVLPSHLFEAVSKIQDTVLICATRVAQRTALAALGAGRSYCDRHVARLAGVRRSVYTRFAEIADLCEAPVAAGAFYVLIGVKTRLGSMAVAERLVREHRVAVVPGDAFGMTDGCHLRVSYGALDPGSVEEGLDRLVRGLRAIVA
jgi:aspartate/methionine/tyrosine aminotransferase